MTEKIIAEVYERFGVRMTCGKERTVTELYQEEEKTSFGFSYKNARYTGSIPMGGETGRALALLLVSYFENREDSQAELSKAERLKAILLGETSPASTYRFMSKYALKTEPCFALAVTTNKLLDETVNILGQYEENERSEVVKMSDELCAIVKFVAPSEDNEYHSATEYAEFVAQSLKEELGVDVAVGVGPTVRELKDISLSYAQATSALRYAEVFGAKGRVHAYREFMLVKMLEDASVQKLEEYFAQLTDDSAKEIFEDEEMLSTAEEFLQHNLNAAETSRNLYMHRNTLLYRLEKIEKATGLNIRQFSDAVSFRVLTVLYKLLGK
jgi:carbohydrate diacid regulator